MKKLFASLMLAGAAFSAKAAIFINNNTSYTVYVTFWAHDAVLPAPCAYISNRMPIDGGTSAAFNNVTSPGLAWGIPWNLPSTPGLAGSGFDAIDLVPTVSGLYWATIGKPGGCATSTSYVTSGGGYSINATWTDIGGGNVLVQINP